MNKITESNKKYPVYFYVILFLTPILFFTLLELGLRLADYGESLPQWTSLSESFPEKQTLNHYIAKRYFTNIEDVPTPWPDGFDRVKKPNTFRIFVLGESSAAGYPYDVNASFPREVKRRLDIMFPGSNNEVINLSMSAISSYVLADLIDGVIGQKPDLVLIYTGHNEYYGALGVGSSENLGSFPSVVRFLIKAESFKTVQLLKNIIKSFLKLSVSAPSDDSGTLMKRMVAEQHIPLNSDLFQMGIQQFSSNMNVILSSLKEKNIPVVIGNLTSNIRSQKPFVSEEFNQLQSAGKIFLQADSLLKTDVRLSKEKFIEAKELDLLRFRAPIAINQEIRSLSKFYNIPFVDIDSIFNASSLYGITGDDLMIDHLHPNIEGYRLMGKSFFDSMVKNNLLPKSEKRNLTTSELNSEANRIFPLTGLDSLLAEIKVRRLKASWPFVDAEIKQVDPLSFFTISNSKEKYVSEILNKKITWEQGHYELGQEYLAKGDYNNFRREFDALIAYASYNDSPYEFVANKLLSAGLTNEAMDYIRPLHKIKPSAFTNKWLGIHALLSKKYEEAMNFLEKSYQINPNDGQVAYNLSGAYFYNKKAKDALRLIDDCLKLNPDFQDGIRFKHYLTQQMKR